MKICARSFMCSACVDRKRPCIIIAFDYEQTVAGSGFIPTLCPYARDENRTKWEDMGIIDNFDIDTFQNILTAQKL